MKTIEECRTFWAKMAKEYKWHTTPFYVQVWVNPQGKIIDSVSHRGMTKDIIIKVGAEE